MSKLNSSLIALLYLVLIAACSDDPGNSPDDDTEYTVTVTAGDFDRQETVVSFSLPDYIEQGVYQMTVVNADEQVWVQVDDNSKARFILEELAAGESRSYQLEPEPLTGYDNTISSSLDERTITFTSDGGEVFSYYHSEHELPEDLDDSFSRGGYLHPVRSPGGVQVTDRFSEGHPHQLGIFSAWTSTEFEGRTPDFWNLPDETGTVEVDSLDEVWEGPVFGGFRSRHGFVDLRGPEPERALNEQWEVYAYPPTGDDSFFIFDLTVTQSANTGKPLLLPEYFYGGVAIRGHDEWYYNPENVTFLTSGGHDREASNEERVRWVHMGGEVDGEVAGISQFGHPGNPRHPQPVRVHPDDPYFVYTPMQLGDMSIEPGSPWTMRYRYITYDGEPSADDLNRIWNDYAYPPGVTVE